MSPDSKPNGFNLYDTLGNVQEWTDDGYTTYASFPSNNVDPIGFPSAFDVAFFGGNFDTHHKDLYVERRGSTNPTYSGPVLGFRVARTAP